MASHAIGGQAWPEGTTVSVYPANAWTDSSRSPAGTALDTSTVASGSVTFTGLAENVRYVAYGGGKGVTFLVRPDRRPELSGDRAPDRQRIGELEERSGFYGGGGSAALRNEMANLTNADPFSFGLAAVRATDDTTTNHDGAFFGVDVVTPGNTKAHVAMQAVARVGVAGGNAWGLNTLVQSDQSHAGGGMGVWSAEFDVNYNPPSGAGSEGLWTEAHNVRGITVATGGSGRPQFAIGVEHQHGQAPWVYGIRFAAAYDGATYEAAIWDSGADIVSEGASLTHTLWESHLLHNTQPAFKLRADGHMYFGDGTAAPDTEIFRFAAGSIGVAGNLVASGDLYAQGNDIILGGAGTEGLGRSQDGVVYVRNALNFLAAVSAASVPANTLFLDSADNIIKQKNNSGTVSAI